MQPASKASGELRNAAGMERRAVPGELSGRRGVATLVRSFPVAVAFPLIAASLRRNLEVCNNIADNLSKAGWGLGYVSAIDSNGRTIWIVDAHRDNGKRFVVHADEKLIVFLELEVAIRGCGKLPHPVRGEPTCHWRPRS
jgi:hypothetical protein